jgi:hypothetical protein
MRLAVLPFVLCLILSACVAPEDVQQVPPTGPSATSDTPKLVAGATFAEPSTRGSAKGSGHIRFTGGDGSSIDRAIVIEGAYGEMDGVQSEYDWLARNRPGWRTESQGLVTKGNRQFDVLNIVKGGQRAQVWFDITGYFGKF